jgi:Xaa-Pro aminopeptidase
LTQALHAIERAMFDPHIYQKRRERLVAALGEGDAALVPNATVRFRNRDAEHPFRSDSDFAYLTGFPEPDAVAVLLPGHPDHPFVLFVAPRDPDKEVWTGRRAGVEGARERYGADRAFPLAELDERMPELLADRERLHLPLAQDAALDERVRGWLAATRAKERQGVRAPHSLVDLTEILHEQRLIKGPEELDAMRTAARISAEAHARAQAVCRPGMAEYQVQAELEYLFAYHGADAPAYPSIVAGGDNACVLHYTENADTLSEGDFLLIDAGCEYQGYAADITRTFPVGEAVSGPRADLWHIVAEAQQAAIDQVRPGNSFDDYHQAAVRVLTRGLIDLGLLTGEVDPLIEDAAYRRFFLHRTGHWLGRDVHDVGRYKDHGGAWRTLEPGMVLTVEPGLYIPADAEDAPTELRGTGVRIEDDIHVTADGPENLTIDAPNPNPQRA